MSDLLPKLSEPQAQHPTTKYPARVDVGEAVQADSEEPERNPECLARQCESSGRLVLRLIVEGVV